MTPNLQTFLGLFQNASLLLAAALLYDVSAKKWQTGKPLHSQIVVGLALAAIGLVVMLTPWTFLPGIVFDTRSILISVVGLFFGALPTLVVVAATAAFRFHQGGLGALTGVYVIIASGAIGLGWRHLRRGPLAGASWRELYCFGLVVHVVMLALMLTLPWEVASSVLLNISLPVLLIYPVGTALLGSLLLNRLGRLRMEFDLRCSEERYKRAKESAEAASRAKSEFLANMSHELRTPINGVLGMLQLLRTSPLNAEQAEYSDLAIQSIQRLNRLLSDILDISRVEAGKLQINAEPFDLQQALSEVVELFRPLSVQSGVELRHHFDPDLRRMVVGDALRLQQVLTNLLGNAFKFTDAGSVTLEIAPLPVGDPGKLRVLFSVSDTGSGIPEELGDRLFEPFIQAGQGYQRPNQGAGLGLSICRTLVGLMGGSIAVENREGGGSVFCFSALFGATDQKATEAAQAPEQAEPLRVALRVLLVEDDRVSRLAAARQLERDGHAVTVADDGRQALEELRHESFDLILMDIQMPGMDGVEATRIIRSDPEFRGKAAIPIIAMTAYAMNGDRQRFLAAGMDDYVSKPVSTEALRNVVRGVLHKMASV